MYLSIIMHYQLELTLQCIYRVTFLVLKLSKSLKCKMTFMVQTLITLAVFVLAGNHICVSWFYYLYGRSMRLINPIYLCSHSVTNLVSFLFSRGLWSETFIHTKRWSTQIHVKVASHLYNFTQSNSIDLSTFVYVLKT